MGTSLSREAISIREPRSLAVKQGHSSVISMKNLKGIFIAENHNYPEHRTCYNGRQTVSLVFHKEGECSDLPANIISDI